MQVFCYLVSKEIIPRHGNLSIVLHFYLTACFSVGTMYSYDKPKGVAGITSPLKCQEECQKEADCYYWNYWPEGSSNEYGLQGSCNLIQSERENHTRPNIQSTAGPKICSEGKVHSCQNR